MVKPVGRGGLDYPDFGILTTPHQNPVEISRAELGVRLGSSHVFEQTGNVLYTEVFETGLNDWYLTTFGAANEAYLAAPTRYGKGHSAKLHTNGVAGAFSGMGKNFPFPYPSVMGFEFSFYTRAVFKYIRWQIGFYDGITAKWAEIKIDNENDEILLSENLIDYQKITNYDLKTHIQSGWHTVKLVIDFVNDMYIRLSFDTEDYSLSGYGLFTYGSTAQLNLHYGLVLFGKTGQSEYIYIDNILITLNEPT